MHSHISSQARLRALAGAARALGGSESLERVLETGAEEARAVLGAASASVRRLLPGTLTVRTVVNVGDLGPHEVRWPEDESFGIDERGGLALVLDKLETWSWAADDPTCPGDERGLLDRLEKGSSLGAPIVVDGRLWGEFYATRHLGEPGFDDTDAAATEAVLAVVGSAVSRALREETLEQLAYQDPLTGLLNRRALDEHAQSAFTVSHGRFRRITAVTLDINRLKEVNDTLGHEAGDDLITSVGRDLALAYGELPGAVVARVGGDEFTVLVPDVAAQAVVRVSDELCRRVFTLGTGVSAGAASVVVGARSAITAPDLFAAADRAQYVAKRGRLQTTVLADETGSLLERRSGRNADR